MFLDSSPESNFHPWIILRQIKRSHPQTDRVDPPASINPRQLSVIIDFALRITLGALPGLNSAQTFSQYVVQQTGTPPLDRWWGMTDTLGFLAVNSPDHRSLWPSELLFPWRNIKYQHKCYKLLRSIYRFRAAQVAPQNSRDWWTFRNCSSLNLGYPGLYGGKRHGCIVL